MMLIRFVQITYFLPRQLGIFDSISNYYIYTKEFI